MHAHLAAQIGQRSPLRLRPDSVTTDRVIEQGPVVRLDTLELRSVFLDQAQHSLAAGERLRRGNRGLRLHEYADQARAVFLGEHASELQDACRLGVPIDEDDDFPKLGSALLSAQDGRFRQPRPRRLIAGHSSSFPLVPTSLAVGLSY